MLRPRELQRKVLIAFAVDQIGNPTALNTHQNGERPQRKNVAKWATLSNLLFDLEEFGMRLNFRSFCIGALAVTGVALISTSFVPKAHADEWNKRTIVTVNEPIIAGNKVLDPGTYVWLLMDSPSNRHIVQIFDKDQRHLETTVLAIPDYRMQPTGKTQFAFWETPAGVPKAVRDWYYPGDNYGQEFPYPKKLVAQLASAQPVAVPSNYREPEPAVAPVPRQFPHRKLSLFLSPFLLRNRLRNQCRSQKAHLRRKFNQLPFSSHKALPHTGSFNPLIGLLGLTSLSFAGLLTLVTRRS